jgi:AraC-like DNA-binding protein
MYESPDIIAMAYGQPVMIDGLELLHDRGKRIPGTWQYSIRRFREKSLSAMEDTALLVYHHTKNEPESRYIELKFCISGQTYCQDRNLDCDLCKEQNSADCRHLTRTLDLLRFRFEPSHLTHFAKGRKKDSQAVALLNFQHTESFSRSIPLNGKIMTVLSSLMGNTYTDILEDIFINAQTQILILYTLESMYGSMEEYEVPACKFLANEEDREKIIRAREILLRHIGEPLTIKELSRKAAINECYLKKGFKVLFGTTIFDFYQDQRMEHAKYLLFEKGRTVSEVSVSLGYSSISHFSTAFKKHTGLKPCELLAR